MTQKKFLDTVYDLVSPEATRDLYDAWSASYDAEVLANGYATPGRIAAALARHVSDKTNPVLDFGCGTGLSGAALRLAGFEVVDGADMSPEMLTQAERKQIYRKLFQLEVDQPWPFVKGDYVAICACGVIGVGAAPVSVLDALIEVLSKDGILAFSFNDKTLKDRSFEARLNDHLDGGTARLLARDYGPHLPARDMKSMIYVVEKT